MAENKPRKRGRRKLADSTPPAIAEEEPSRKRPKRLSTQSESPKATGKKEKALKSTGGKGLRSEVTSGRPRRADKKKLLISLNIEDNDLQVHGQAEAAELAVPKPGSRGGGRGRGRSRQNGVNDHRSQSVGSDGGGSTNSSVVSSNNNGRTSACFKNPNFTFSSVGPNKKKIWKNLKQILSAEKSAGMNPSTPTYASIDAPPSFKPPKKYSDISGLTAKYTDPLTGIHFSSSEEFQIIRTLPQDIVQGYLALRGKMTIT